MLVSTDMEKMKQLPTHLRIPNCTCSWSSCCPNLKNLAPRAFLEVFLMSSSDVGHITSMRTEVWHLCKHIWLGCFLIRDWKQGLPYSGTCLWRDSFIKVSIQLCVLLSACCFLITYWKLAGFLHPHLVEQKHLVRQLRQMKEITVSHLSCPSMKMAPFNLVVVTTSLL